MVPSTNVAPTAPEFVSISQPVRLAAGTLPFTGLLIPEVIGIGIVCLALGMALRRYMASRVKKKKKKEASRRTRG
jgi:hypothetical protein